MTAFTQSPRLVRAMNDLTAVAEAFSGPCFRYVKPKYGNSQDAFSGEGSRQVSGRFHVKGNFLIVYTSTDLKTALWENSNTARSIGLDTAYLLPLTAISANVTFSKVLNLSDSSVRKALKVTLREIRTSMWAGSAKETPTQIIGRLTYKAGFEAILSPSAGKGQNLNFFPQNLLPDSVIAIINPQELPGV